MNEQTESSEIPSILTNKNEASLSLPLLPKDEYVFHVTKVTLIENKEKGSQLIRINMKTTQDTKDALGKQTLKAGFPQFDQISLTPTDNYTLEMIQRRLKQFRAAVTGDKSNAAFFPLQQYEGQAVKVNVGISPAKDGFEEKNNYRYIVPKD